MLSSPLVDIKTTEPVILGQGQWITLEQLHYFDINGVKRPWERCVRKNTAAPLADAVDIYAILKSDEGSHLLLVVQYRPAIEKYAIEFPSGLIDIQETPLDAACRELREETGYQVEKDAIRLSTRSVCYEPGLTNSTCYVAHVSIDTTSIKTPPIPEREQDEWSLQNLILPINNLMTHLSELQDRHNLIIDSRVYAFAAGLDLVE